MKNWFIKLNTVLFFVFAALAMAAGVGPTEIVEVPGIGDVLAINFGALFAQMAALTAALNVVGAFLRHGAKLGGLPLYAAIVVIGVVAGGAGQFLGLLTAPDYATIPTPIGGIAFGLNAALVAVGLNQGKRVVTGADRGPTNTPTNTPSKSVPPSGY